MRIVVTGGSGFLGQQFVQLCRASGIDVINMGRKQCASSEGFVKCNLLDTDRVAQVLSDLRPTHLVHFAWSVEPGKFWNSSNNFLWMNTTVSLVDTFFRLGGEHASLLGSCAEYDWRYGYCSEILTPLRGLSNYSVSKIATFHSTQKLANVYGVSSCWIRIFYPFGAHEHRDRLIPKIFEAFRNRLPLDYLETGMHRDLIHVSDVAQGIFLCLKNQIDGPINLGTGNPTSIETIITEIAKLTGLNSEIVFGNEAPVDGERRMVFANNARLAGLGWSPEVDLREGLSEYL